MAWSMETSAVSITPTVARAAATTATVDAISTQDVPKHRTSLTGTWVLNKSRGSPSMRGYLEAMNVDSLAIEAHEKGEAEHDTIHNIVLTDSSYRIHKLSRVNDLTLELVLGRELIETLPPHPAAGERTRRSLGQSDHQGHVRVDSVLRTVSGTARVTDVKTLVNEAHVPSGLPTSILVQTLTIVCEETGRSNTTTRYFVPYSGEMRAASTAGGSRRDRGLGPVGAAGLGPGEERHGTPDLDEF